MTTEEKELKLLTAEEFFCLPDNGMKQELIDGKVIEMPPAGSRHGSVAFRTALSIGVWVEERDLGYVTTNDAGFILGRDPDTVRAPDVCFFAKDRLPSGPPDRYTDVLPDLTVEVASPSDTRAAVRAETAQWRRAGVRLAISIFPDTRTVEAATDDGTRILHVGDVLTDDPVLPGFSVPVAALFQRP